MIGLVSKRRGSSGVCTYEDWRAAAQGRAGGEGASLRETCVVPPGIGGEER